MTLYPFIFVRKGVSITLIRHELIHVYQIRRDGWWNFYFGYIWRKLRGTAYLDEQYEREAYTFQGSLKYLPPHLEDLVWISKQKLS